MLSVEDWAEIRRLRRSERLSISEIARVLGISRNTVKAALASVGPPKYSGCRRGRWSMRSSRGSGSCCGRSRDAGDGDRGADRLDPFDPHTERPGRGVAAVYLPPDPASRTMYVAGEIAQCDFWFPDIVVPVGYGQSRTATQLPVLTMVCGYSRWASGVLVPTRCAEDLYAGWWQHIRELGSTPRVLVWDGEGAVGRWRKRPPELTAACQAFRGTLAAKVLICKPGGPGGQGLGGAVPRLPGAVVPAGPGVHLTGRFQHPVAAWLVRANHRHHRTLGCARPTGSPVTGRRCSSCRRCRRRRGGGREPGSRGITTCGWTATTTRCTRR